MSGRTLGEILATAADLGGPQRQLQINKGLKDTDSRLLLGLAQSPRMLVKPIEDLAIVVGIGLTDGEEQARDGCQGEIIRRRSEPTQRLLCFTLFGATEGRHAGRQEVVRVSTRIGKK
ncbi:hypothetical protein [Phycicoccus jejuensis]|uniref:hypothetical protein n=1 Tax=Phycicoccus jejuensis TaxID=367299 RepID=UPI0004C3CAC5|nr:hypothetical protein [Phycicoccus jejuensis]